jgi:hypothetical protein
MLGTTAALGAANKAARHDLSGRKPVSFNVRVIRHAPIRVRCREANAPRTKVLMAQASPSSSGTRFPAAGAKEPLGSNRHKVPSQLPKLNTPLGEKPVVYHWIRSAA